MRRSRLFVALLAMALATIPVRGIGGERLGAPQEPVDVAQSTAVAPQPTAAAPAPATGAATTPEVPALEPPLAKGPAPDLDLVFTSQVIGWIEPCG